MEIYKKNIYNHQKAQTRKVLPLGYVLKFSFFFGGENRAKRKENIKWQKNEGKVHWINRLERGQVIFFHSNIFSAYVLVLILCVFEFRSIDFILLKLKKKESVCDLTFKTTCGWVFWVAFHKPNNNNSKSEKPKKWK